MSAVLPLWVELLVGLLLVTSGVLSLIGAWGFLRLPDFFQRMHPPTLAYTLGTWCTALACIIYFSVTQLQLALYAWLIIILLSITAPVTTMLLARAALFRRRQAGEPAPPPLSQPLSQPK